MGGDIECYLIASQQGVTEGSRGQERRMVTGVTLNTSTTVESLGLSDTSCGAVWRRVDLHLHSPGIESFRCPNGTDTQTDAGRQRLIEAYVRRMRDAKIEIGAITDYNGVRPEWFLPIRAEARKYGITLLPGAELSFQTGKYGLHVLAVFDEEADIEQVSSFLQSLDRDAATPLIRPDRTHRDIDLKESVPVALKSLRERFGCLLILSHPDQQNGLCKSLQPVNAARLLKEISPDALEYCSDVEVRKLQSTAVLDSKFFERLSFVEFSDPHCLDEIGGKKRPDGTLRATYLKLSATDLEAIRLALRDPETRLCLGDVPPAVHARIRRMAVSGSGFLGNLLIEWNDDLNGLIGGRGVGKSAIVETLRYALAMEPYSDHSYREELVRHALGSGGKVEVILERPIGDGDSRRYLVARVWGEEPRIIEVDSEKPLAVHPSSLLGPNGGPTIFGQREIYAVSGSEEYRLALLDELIGEEARNRASAVREAIERLRANARAILDIRTRLVKREEYRQRLKTIEHELGIYEKHGAAEKLGEATRLRSDGQHLRGATDAVGRVYKEWMEVSQNLLAPLETTYRSLLRGQSQQKAILQEVAKIVERLQADLKAVFEQASLSLSQAERGIKELRARWQELLRPLAEEINRIKQEAQTEALDPDRLLRLTEERTALMPLIEELDRSEDRLKELLKKRQLLLAEVRERRHAEHQLRRERAETIGGLLQGRLRLKVEFKGQKTPVVVINIPKGDMRPYRTHRGVYYIRTTSGRRQASREELLRLFQATESLYYDETPMPRLTLADLDLDALDRYLELTGQAELKGDRERLLMNWGLLSGGHPTLAGVILFGWEPQRQLPFAQINAARFPGLDSSVEPSDRKDLTGRILGVIDQAERFLDLHLRTPHEIRGFQPEPRPELPKEALREAIVNAVAHRDYTVRGPVRLFILEDRVEVHTPGKPPNTVDEGAMRAGVHVVRNPRIYARLSDAGLVTRAGTGVRRIIRLVREATGREVEIAIRDFEVLLTIPRKTSVGISE